MDLLRNLSRITCLGLLLAGCAASESSPHSISEPNRVGTDRYPVVRASTGAAVELTRNDGSVVRGKYLGMGRMDPDDYGRHWAEVLGAASRDSVALPLPGAMLDLRTRGGRQRAVRFEGFGFRGLEIRDDAGRPESIPFATLADVRGSGERRWPPARLAEAADRRALPMLSVVRLQVGTGELRIPSDQIVEAEDRSSHDVATLALVALVVFATVALAAYVANPFSGVTW